MTFGFPRKAAVLALILILAGASLFALARARGVAPDLASSLETLRAAQVARAEAALAREGGSRILLKLDAEALRDSILTGMRDDVRRILREQRVPFAGLAVHAGSLDVRIREPQDRERVLDALAALNAPGATRAGKIEIAPLEGLVRLTPSAPEFAEHLRDLRQYATGVIEQRLGELGVAGSAVQHDGADRIRVLLPGAKDTGRLSAVIDKRARITFRLVDLSVSAGQALRDGPPTGSEVVYERNSKLPYLVRRQVVLEGSDIADASPSLDQRTDQPIVTFRFNANGTRRFAEVTRENVGKPFAVLLDDEVIAAPVIREPILGGSGQISGDFTVKDADRIAVLMRAGTLPGHLVVVEQQVVEPGG